MKSQKIWTSLRMDVDHFQRVKEFALKFRISRSDVLRQALCLGITAFPKTVRSQTSEQIKSGNRREQRR
jgi:hypothetical protein